MQLSIEKGFLIILNVISVCLESAGKHRDACVCVYVRSDLFLLVFTCHTKVGFGYFLLSLLVVVMVMVRVVVFVL